MIISSFFAGVLAAGLHVVSGPDHLAAITPLAIETRKKVWRIGLFWGFGHLTGMLVIGLLFLAFKEVIPVERISEYSEQLVGLVLIGVGLWAIFRIFFKGKEHRHPHIHGGEKPYIHMHDHNHGDGLLRHEHAHSKAIQQNSWSSFIIGILHGLAGIAHFILLLPVLGFENRWEGSLYIMGFAAGTVLTMVAYAFILGWLSKGSEKLQNPTAFQGIRIVAGLFAIIVGFYWLYLGF